MKYLLASLFILSACSFKKDPLGNQTDKGHEELYSEPEGPKLSKLEKNQKRVVIAATNDVEGRYAPHRVTVKDEHSKKKQKISLGGAEAMSAYFKILRDKYSNVVLLDSGDIFSAKTSIKEVQDFYGSNKYDAVTVGLGDFNLKLPKGIKSNTELFREFARGSETPLVLSNLYELKTARVVEWKGTVPYLLKEVDGVKVGIIGLIPDDIATLTPVDNRVGLFVEGMLQSTLRQARLLRSLGASIVVVLAHHGIPCGQELAQESRLPLKKVNFEPSRKGVCETKGVLGAYLERLPPHLVDVVIGGRHHQKMANYVNETLVLSGFEKGKSMSFVEFVVDTKAGKVIKEETVVHQPVMFCHEFFKETSDCFTEDRSVNHGPRTPAVFLGETIELQKEKDHHVGETENAAPDYRKAMQELGADLVFAPETSGNSQLVQFKVSGERLIALLEEEYNKGAQRNWLPDPFFVKNDFLHLYIKGEEVRPGKTYSILADLEALQSARLMKNWIQDAASKALMGFSWSSFLEIDSVETKMAAQARVRAVR